MRHARFDADKMIAASNRFGHGHGRTDTKFAGLVTRRCDDAAVSTATYDQWFAAKLRIVPLFNGRVKGIHINMQNAAR